MPYDISYEYDAGGNRTRKVDNLTGGVTTYTYDAANQLQTEQTVAVTTTYTFDRAGNMETITKPVGQVTTYVWDAENRRTAVETSGGAVEATYNADGLRIQNGDRTFLWDGQAYLAETDLAGDVRTLYTVQPSRYGRLISQKRSSTTGSECFHFDALGSTVSISEAGERYIYDAWGNLLSSNSFKPAFLYVGEYGYYADGGGGEYYVRARYLSSAIARFINRDPLGLDPGKSGYDYAEENPVLYRDPSGLRAIVEFAGLIDETQPCRVPTTGCFQYAWTASFATFYESPIPFAQMPLPWHRLNPVPIVLPPPYGAMILDPALLDRLPSVFPNVRFGVWLQRMDIYRYCIPCTFPEALIYNPHQFHFWEWFNASEIGGFRVAYKTDIHSTGTFLGCNCVCFSTVNVESSLGMVFDVIPSPNGFGGQLEMDDTSPSQEYFNRTFVRAGHGVRIGPIHAWGYAVACAGGHCAMISSYGLSR